MPRRNPGIGRRLARPAGAAAGPESGHRPPLPLGLRRGIRVPAAARRGRRAGIPRFTARARAGQTR